MSNVAYTPTQPRTCNSCCLHLHNNAPGVRVETTSL